MKCKLACKKHSKFKSFGRRFIGFWHEYFQSTGTSVRDLPIKCFLSAVDLVKLCDLSACNCKNLVKILFPDPSFVCNYCQKTFPTMIEMEMHVAEMKMKIASQSNQRRKQFQCVFCTKYLLSRATLIRHMELHTSDYECKICKKSVNSFDIDRHKTTRAHLKRAKNQSRHQQQSLNKM